MAGTNSGISDATKTRTYVVTGGVVFIGGSHIVEALARRGQHVRVFDSLSTG